MSIFRAVGGGKLLSDADPKTVGPANCIKRVNVRRSDDAETLFPGWRLFGGERLSAAISLIGGVYNEEEMTGISIIPDHGLEVQDFVNIDFDDGSTLVAIVEGVDGDLVEWVDSSRIFTAPNVIGANGQDFESSTNLSISQYIYLLVDVSQDFNDFEGGINYVNAYLHSFNDFYGEDFEDSTTAVVIQIDVPLDLVDFEGSTSEQIQVYLFSGFSGIQGVDFEDNSDIQSYIFNF